MPLGETPYRCDGILRMVQSRGKCELSAVSARSPTTCLRSTRDTARPPVSVEALARIHRARRMGVEKADLRNRGRAHERSPRRDLRTHLQAAAAGHASGEDVAQLG